MYFGKKVLCSAEKSSVIWAEPHSRSSAEPNVRSITNVKCGLTIKPPIAYLINYPIIKGYVNVLVRYNIWFTNSTWECPPPRIFVLHWRICVKMIYMSCTWHTNDARPTSDARYYKYLCNIQLWGFQQLDKW